MPVKIVLAGDMDLLGPMRPQREKSFILNLVQQKFVLRVGDGLPIMAAVFRDAQSGLTFRIEDEGVIQKVVGQIVRNHILKEPDRNLKQQYMGVATRILKGYGLEPTKIITNHIDKAEKVVGNSKELDRGLGL